jgi:hypothetical protein
MKSIGDIINGMQWMNVEKGYVLLHMDLDAYLFVDDKLRWDVDNFSSIDEKTIDVLRDWVWRGQPSFALIPLLLPLFQFIFDMVDFILVIPCVKCEGEEPKLDFVNAFKFDEAK